MRILFLMVTLSLLSACIVETPKNKATKSKPSQARISGHIENYSTSDSITSLEFYWLDLVDGYVREKTEIDSLGNFDIAFDLTRQIELSFYYKKFLKLIVKGGDKLTISFDGNNTVPAQYFRSASVNGTGSEVNRKLFKYLAGRHFDKRFFYQKTRSMRPKEFKNFNDSITRENRTYIDNFIDENDVSGILEDWLSVERNVVPLEQKMAYRFNYLMALKTKKEKDEFSKSFFASPLGVPKIHEGMLVHSNLIGSFTNMYSYYMLDKVSLNHNITRKDTLCHLLFNHLINYNSENPLLAQLAINEQLSASFENNDFKIYTDNQEMLDPLFAESAFAPYHEKIIEEIKQRLSNPVLPEKTQLLTFDTSDTSKYLEEIIKNANGKVIYIDNWATWCAPCKSEFKDGAPELKAKFGNNIEFVYLCHRSKEELWKPTIAQFKVEGKHYFIGKNQGEELTKQVRIKGFPSYTIIDQKGEIVKTGFEYRPSMPATSKLLEDLLAQN